LTPFTPIHYTHLILIIFLSFNWVRIPMHFPTTTNNTYVDLEESYSFAFQHP